MEGEKGYYTISIYNEHTAALYRNNKDKSGMIEAYTGNLHSLKTWIEEIKTRYEIREVFGMKYLQTNEIDIPKYSVYRTY